MRPAAFFRTTLPMDFSVLADIDSGRYHSVWLPDHMVSFWPDAIWTPEFTDLATVSRSPHRHVDGLAVAAAVAARTSKVDIATCVVDTIRRHPAMLAQTALTIDHIAQGRFILGLGSGEIENCGPYGFPFHKPVGRFEEAVKVIRLLWESTGPIDFEGEFFTLHHARMDAELYQGRPPRIWIGASGPRMIDIAGRLGDGWWPAGVYTAEEYATKLGMVRQAAEKAGRDPRAITPALIMTCLLGTGEELQRIAATPLVKAFILQMTGEMVRAKGFAHPMGDGWRGIHDLDPGALTREMVIDILARTSPEMVLAVVPHGTPHEIARLFATYAQAGLRVPKILDYGGMAGLAYAADSARKVREAEDEFIRLTEGL